MIKQKKISLVGLLIAIIVILSHSINLFGYPYYENDEGIYMSQAWSVATQGKLSPYTYWYDHAPAGWLLIAGWSKLTGGFSTFGLSVNSGRVLILLLYLASSYFIFQIVKKYTNNFWAGTLAVILFALSPLSNYYGRRVLLDNIMVFWLLWAFYILFKSKISSWQYYLSAVFFGIAVLTKESALVFYPAFLYLIYFRYSFAKNKIKLFSWFLVSLFVISLYPFYAWTQGELWVNQPNSPSQHISLIESFKWQASRGNQLPFWNRESEFRRAWSDWTFRDAYLIIVGTISSLIIIILSIFKKPLKIIALALIFYFIFLVRGGLILNFYIIPLIPFMVISVGILFHYLLKRAKQRKAKKQVIVIILIALAILGGIIYHSSDQYFKNETRPQKEIVQWIKTNLPADTKIAIDDYAYVDYHSPKYLNNKVFQDANVFWKIENDDKIRDGVYHNDWFQIQYIASSNTLDNLLKAGQLDLVRKAYNHSQKIKSWQADDTNWSYKTSLRKIMSTNSLQPKKEIKSLAKHQPEINQQLKDSWEFYKKNFIHNYGQVIDPSNGVTTSEGQSYAMLRAVWMNDEDTFRGTWQWAKDHLQFRTQDKLFSWKWQNDKLADFNNATDADEDIALALIFGFKKWNKDEYLKASQELLNSIWEECVVEVEGHYYLLPINHNIATQWNGYLLNPSYLSPASYRIFARVDNKHNWNKLADDSYWVLDQVNQMPNNRIKLPPNWLLVELKTGKLLSAKKMQGENADYFGFDAFRTLWRVALDREWFKSQKADQYLQAGQRFVTNYYSQHQKLPMEINVNGKVIQSQASIAVNAGYLSILLAGENETLLNKFYQNQIQNTYHSEQGYWQSSDDYYGNNWAWFATALYNGDLINLAKEK